MAIDDRLVLEPGEVLVGRLLVRPALCRMMSETEDIGHGETLTTAYYSLRFPGGFTIWLSKSSKPSFSPMWYGVSPCCEDFIVGDYGSDKRYHACCSRCREPLGHVANRMGVMGPLMTIRPRQEDAFRAWVEELYALQLGPLEAAMDGAAAAEVCFILGWHLDETLAALS